MGHEIVLTVGQNNQLTTDEIMELTFKGHKGKGQVFWSEIGMSMVSIQNLML
jgi:hypothetical protein